MSSSADESYHSDTGDDLNTTPVTNETPGGSDTNPLTDTPIFDKPGPLSDSPESAKSTAATNAAVASPISDLAAIVEVLLKFGFKLSPGADPIDEQTHRIRLDPLRQLAACLGTPSPDQLKDKFLLVKFDRNAVLDSGLTAQ